MTISDVKFEDSRYRVFDEDSNEVRTFWDSEGDLAGFGRDFLVFERDGRYRFVSAESGDEIASEWKDSTGRLMHVNTDLAVFVRDGRVHTRRFGYSGLSELSSRWQ
jgi:hypothetical protein